MADKEEKAEDNYEDDYQDEEEETGGELTITVAEARVTRDVDYIGK